MSANSAIVGPIRVVAEYRQGYDATTLESIPIGTAGAVTQVLRAKKPCQGYVVGVPGVVVDFLPLFSASPYVL